MRKFLERVARAGLAAARRQLETWNEPEKEDTTARPPPKERPMTEAETNAAEAIDYDQYSDDQIKNQLGVSCFGALWDANDVRCQTQCPVENRCAIYLVHRRIPDMVRMLGGGESGTAIPDQVVAAELNMDMENLTKIRQRVESGQPLVQPEQETVQIEEESEEPAPPPTQEAEEEVDEEAAADAAIEEHMAAKTGKTTKKKTASKKKAATKKKAPQKKAAAAEKPKQPKAPKTEAQKAAEKKNGASGGPRPIVNEASFSPAVQGICDALAENFGILYKAGTTEQMILEGLPGVLSQLKQYTHGVEGAVADTNEELLKEVTLLRALLSQATIDPEAVVELPATEILGLLQHRL